MNTIKSPNNDYTFLIYQDKWFLKINHNIINIDTSDFLVVVNLYQFLEKEEDYYLNMLNNSDAISSFPYKEIILSGFIQNTDFWVSKSISWLNKKNQNEWFLFKDFLNNIYNNMGFNQKTRQLAKKMVFYINKSNIANIKE